MKLEIIACKNENREAKRVKSDMQTQIKCHKGVQVVKHFAWEAGTLPTKRMHT